MKRAVVVVDCDNCHKTVELETEGEPMPLPWRHLLLRDSEHSNGAHDGMAGPVLLDVCSSGCGEKALIAALRSMYEPRPSEPSR